HQQGVRHEAMLDERGGDQYRHHETEGRQCVGQRRGVDAAVEVGQPYQAQRAGHRKEAGNNQQKGDDEGGPGGQFCTHGSITSPRSRNLAMATEPTKPNTQMSSAMSKYRGELKRKPSVSRISMPLIYMASSASTRSAMDGPAVMR